MRYLKKTSDIGILYTYKKPDSSSVVGYADAGCKSDPRRGKSQGGYAFVMNGAALS